MPIPEFKEAATAHLSAQVKAGAVYLNCDASTLPKILEAARFKSSFETGGSNALFNVKARGQAEAMMMGVPHDTPPEVRPIYGYVGQSDFQSHDAGLHHDVRDLYGSVSVRLADAVKDRATIQVGDSMGRSHEVQSTPATAPGFRSLGLTFLQKAGKTALAGKPGDYFKAIDKVRGYMEAQVHGGLATHEIAEVGFKQAPDEATVTALKTAGIPWRMIK
jgi:hypothetical protein